MDSGYIQNKNLDYSLWLYRIQKYIFRNHFKQVNISLYQIDLFDR